MLVCLLVLGVLLAGGCAGAPETAVTRTVPEPEAEPAPSLPELEVLLLVEAPESAVFCFRPKGARVSIVGFSPDGRCLVCRADDDRLRVYDSVTGELMLAVPCPSELAPRGKLLAWASHAISVFDLTLHGAEVFHWEGEAEVLSLALSEDGQFLAAGSDSSICVWDMTANEPLRMLSDVQEGARSLSFSPDSLMLASVGLSGAVSLWDLVDAQRLRTIRLDQGSVTFDCFSADGRAVVLRQTRVTPAPTGPEGVAAFALRTVVFDVASGEKRLDMPDYLWVSGDRQALVRLDPQADGARVYDLASGRQIGRLPVIGPLVFSPSSGVMAACAGVSGGRRVFDFWHLSPMTRTGRCSVPEDRWYCQALSPDGQTLALVHRSRTRVCLLERTAGGKLLELGVASGSEDRSYFGERIIFAPDSSKAAAICGECVVVFDLVALRSGIQGERQDDAGGPAPHQ